MIFEYMKLIYFNTERELCVMDVRGWGSINVMDVRGEGGGSIDHEGEGSGALTMDV